MKKFIPFFCLAFVFVLAGFSSVPEHAASSPAPSPEAASEAVTLFDTPTVKIVLDGKETIVTDKTTGTEYSYITTRKLLAAQPTLEQLQARCIAQTSASTDSIKIELAGALIVVHDLAGDQIYYIDP